MKKLRACQGPCLVLLCAALGACQGAPDAEAMLVSGRDYLEAGDRNAAVIQFKNVLQQRPDSAEARYLLGRMLLEGGDAVGAGVELGKALELGHPAPRLKPLLARSLMMQGQPRAVIERFGAAELADPGADAELKVLLARAHAAEGNVQKADEALRAALARAPEQAEALLLQVRQLAARGEHEAAFAQLERLLVQTPDSAEAWQLKGELLMAARKDEEGALEAHRRALALQADLLDAHSAIVSLHLQRKEAEAAAAQLEQMRARFPGHPQTAFHGAQLALFRRDAAGAKELLDALLKVAPEDPKVQQLAGFAEFQSGSLLQAETHLAKALQLQPELLTARRLLAQTHLRAGRPEKALALVQPALERGEVPPALLELAAEAQLQRGELEQAETLYARLARLDPKDTRSRTGLAVTRMARGDVAAATVELELIAASDPGTLADLALISAQLRHQRLGAALAAIGRLEGKQPGQPLAPYLRGRAHALLKQPGEARAAYEQALARDAAYVPAAVGLAQLDLEEGKPQQARQHFERVLAADPRNVHASMALVELGQRTGAPVQEIEALLADALRRNPAEERPRLALVELHLRRGQVQQALVAAREAVAALPASLTLQEALGRAQLAVGDHQQAVGTFGRLAASQPDSAQAHLRLAGARLAAKDLAGAEESLTRALSLEPQSQEAQLLLAGLYRESGRVPRALALARAMQRQKGNEATGFRLEGDLEAAGGRWGAAAVAYRSGLKTSATGPLAARLHLALTKSGAAAETARFAQEWMREHPQDVVFLSHLGALATLGQDSAQAEAYFRKVLELQPDDPAALNNLAWALLRQGKPGATEHAEKANRLRAGQPAFMDTLAESLAQERQWERALEWQKKAVELDRDNPAYRLRLARIYLGAGQKAQAKEELDRLARSEQGQGKALGAEVEQLMKSL